MNKSEDILSKNITSIIISLLILISILAISSVLFTACSDYVCQIQAPNSIDAQSSGKTVILTWDSVENAELYTIYRYQEIADNAKPIGTTSSTSYTDDNVTTGKTYYYYIQTLAYEEGHQCWSSPSVTASSNS